MNYREIAGESFKQQNQEVISTLPLNPRHFNKLGFYGIFAYLRSLKESRSMQSLAMLNLVDNNSVTHKAELMKKVILLDIVPDQILEDRDIDAKSMQEVLQSLYEDGIIRISIEDVSRCRCGKIQFKTGARLFNTRTTLINSDGTSKCCSSNLINRPSKVLVTRSIKDVDNMPEIYPKWAEKEIKWFFDNTKYELLLSRETIQRYSIALKEDEIYVDPDNLVYFYLLYLQDMGYDISEIISGISTIKQVAFMLSFGAMSGIKLPEKIYFLPRIDFGVSEVGYIERYIDAYGHLRVINALTWAMTSGKKNIRLSEDFIKRANNELIPDSHLAHNRKDLILRKPKK